MCKVYTDEGGIKSFTHVYAPVQKMIRSLKLMDYLQIQTVNPWYNYYLTVCLMSCDCWCALTITYGSMDWPAVHDCGVSWP